MQRFCQESQFNNRIVMRVLNPSLIYVVAVSVVLATLLMIFNKEIQTENSIDDIYDVLGVAGALYLSFSCFVFIPLVIIINVIQWIRKSRHS